MSKEIRKAQEQYFDVLDLPNPSEFAERALVEYNDSFQDSLLSEKVMQPPI